MSSADLTAILDSLRAEFKLPALAGAIVASDGILASTAVGCRQYGGCANVTDRDRFHLGSNTKAFTAALFGVLVENGMTEWTTILADLFPELRPAMRAEFRDVTLREILSHSGGFRRDMWRKPAGGNPAAQRFTAVESILRRAPAGQRGVYRYSNVGYILAGAIAERLTGKHFEELLMDRVLNPLGVTTAGFGSMGNPGSEDQPFQHEKIFWWRRAIRPGPRADNPAVYSPAGRLHMAIGDWALFIQNFLASLREKPGLLKPETARMLASPLIKIDDTNWYGMGWVVVSRPWAAGKALMHAGSNGRNYAIVWVAPGKNFAVLVATNQGRGDTPKAMDAIAGRLIKHAVSQIMPSAF